MVFNADMLPVRPCSTQSSVLGALFRRSGHRCVASMRTDLDDVLQAPLLIFDPPTPSRNHAMSDFELVGAY